MNASLIIGLRYVRARGSNRFLSFMTWVSLLGLMLGVVVLIVVVSVMNGFDSELKRRILGAVPHIVVSANPQTAHELSVKELTEFPGVAEASRFSSHSALLINGSESQLVALYGVQPEHEERMSIIARHTETGSFERLSNDPTGIILGRPLAFRLGLSTGDPVTVLLPIVSGRGGIRTVVLNASLAGTFRLDSELDYHLSVMHFARLESVLGTTDTGYRLKLEDIFSAPLIASRLSQSPGVKVSDWTEDYGDFFRTVKMEKIMMFLLLSLIVGIAAFSIVSSLSMLVKEKQSDIAVLRTCGLSTRGVMLIFIAQGALIGVCGVLLGTLVGVPLAYHVPDIVSQLESLVGGRILAGTYFDSIPTDVRYYDIAVVMLVSLLISLAATVYPAYRAASLRPAEVLRYE
jgi:lipoprotein-releasing system permease protein